MQQAVFTMRYHDLQSRFSILAMLLIGALLGGCASGPQIITNSAPDVDFAAIRTFSFKQPLSTDDGDVRSLLSTTLVEATRTELQSRGWREIPENGEVLVDFQFTAREEIRSPRTGLSIGIGGGGGNVGVGGTVSTPSVEQTTRGELSINIIDPQKRQLVWEGLAKHEVTENVRENQNEATRALVALIFAEFPVANPAQPES